MQKDIYIKRNSTLNWRLNNNRRGWRAAEYWISKTQTRFVRQRGERFLLCALPRCCCCRCSYRSQMPLWVRWGQRSINREKIGRKWPLALMLISAGLEQISRHLSPYLNNNSLLDRLLRSHTVSIIQGCIEGGGDAAQPGYQTIFFNLFYIYSLLIFFLFMVKSSRIKKITPASVCALAPLQGLNKDDSLLTLVLAAESISTCS